MFETEAGNTNEAANEQQAKSAETITSEFEKGLEEHGRVLPVPEVGQRLNATVVRVGDETTFLDYGGRSEATIDTSQLKGPDGEPTCKVGEKIEAYVISNEEAVVLALTLTPALAEAFGTIREAHKSGVPITGKVTAVNSGGLDVEIAGVRTFCPVSQIDAVYCQDPSAFVGQSHDFRVLEFSEGGRRVVVSRKALLMQKREEAAKKLKANLQVGEVRDGTVSRLEPYGAFVDLGGLDGMVHVSEISHDRVAKPSDALKAGDKVRVQILEIGKDAKGRERISLSIKAAQQDPWTFVGEQVVEGSVLTGTVVRLTDFGAFVRVLPGIEGLLHVSEIGEEPVAHPRDVLKEAEEVKVKVLGVDTRRRRISLTMRIDRVGGGSKPSVGETVEGIVRAHKPYGIFVDLPKFGPRASGLLPAEETGTTRGTDLSKQYPSGQKLEVLVQQIDEKGRIRLALTTGGAGGKKGPATFGNRGVPNAMADALRRAMEQGEGK